MRELNTWPGWECVRQLGSGAFGKVYEIQRREYGKTYSAALKVITIPQNSAEIEDAYSEGMDEKSVIEYFRSFVENITDEFALMSELKGHSNIVSYEDHMVIEHEDRIGWDILIRMELLTPVQKWNAVHPVTEEDIIKLGCDICRALEVCQKKNIIHRDIKPENIFVNNYGDFKLGDLGIARTIERTVSNLSSKKGTYSYMAPEVYQGKAYGITADVYSLAMVLYRFLNDNRAPFLPMGVIHYTDREEALLRRMNGEEVPAPLNGSQQLKAIVLKALDYTSAKRYQTAKDFRNALETCRNNDGNYILQDDNEVTYSQADDATVSDNANFENSKASNPMEYNQVKNEIDHYDQTVVSEISKSADIKISNVKSGKKVLIPVLGSIVAIAILFAVLKLFVLNSDVAEDYPESSSVETAEIVTPTPILETKNNEENIADETEMDDETIDYGKGLRAWCQSSILLVGDTTDIYVASDTFRFDNTTSALEFSSDNEAVATIDKYGVITAVAPGSVNLKVEYKDYEAICSLTVTTVDNSSGAYISVDYSRISLGTYGSDTVNFTLGGRSLTNFVAVCYSSAGLRMSYEWGELSAENTLPLTFSCLTSPEKNGEITVLIYSEDDPTRILASSKVSISIK